MSYVIRDNILAGMKQVIRDPNCSPHVCFLAVDPCTALDQSIARTIGGGLRRVARGYQNPCLPVQLSVVDDTQGGEGIYEPTEPVVSKSPSSQTLTLYAPHREERKILFGWRRVVPQVCRVRWLDHLLQERVASMRVSPS